MICDNLAVINNSYHIDIHFLILKSQDFGYFSGFDSPEYSPWTASAPLASSMSEDSTTSGASGLADAQDSADLSSPSCPEGFYNEVNQIQPICCRHLPKTKPQRNYSTFRQRETPAVVRATTAPCALHCAQPQTPFWSRASRSMVEGMEAL